MRRRKGVEETEEVSGMTITKISCADDKDKFRKWSRKIGMPEDIIQMPLLYFKTYK